MCIFVELDVRARSKHSNLPFNLLQWHWWNTKSVWCIFRMEWRGGLKMIYLGHNLSGVTYGVLLQKSALWVCIECVDNLPFMFKKSRLFVCLQTTNYSMQYSWLSDSMNAAVFVWNIPKNLSHTFLPQTSHLSMWYVTRKLWHVCKLFHLLLVQFCLDMFCFILLLHVAFVLLPSVIQYLNGYFVSYIKTEIHFLKGTYVIY